jgi:hypothetical protein
MFSYTEYVEAYDRQTKLYRGFERGIINGGSEIGDYRQQNIGTSVVRCECIGKGSEGLTWSVDGSPVSFHAVVGFTTAIRLGETT